MIEVQYAKRKSAVLTPSDIACLSDIPTINLTAGCAHGCLYCYTRGYTIYPGENKIILYDNILDMLEKELARKRRKPRAVYFSPSSDPFQPVPELLDLTYSVFEFLLRSGIGVSFLTKGNIPEQHFRLIKRYAGQVSAGIGIISVSDSTCGYFEPRASTPRQRLENMKKLTAAGVNTQARLDPILPGVSDSSAEIEGLISKIASAGIRSVAVSVLFLRPAIRKSLESYQAKSGLIEKLLAKFSGSTRLGIHAGKSTVTVLPESERRSLYEKIHTACKTHGIKMKICACKNPDICESSCSIAGESASQSQAVQGQTNLFPETIVKENGDGKRNSS